MDRDYLDDRQFPPGCQRRCARDPRARRAAAVVAARSRRSPAVSERRFRRCRGGAARRPQAADQHRLGTRMTAGVELLDGAALAVAVDDGAVRDRAVVEASGDLPQGSRRCRRRAEAGPGNRRRRDYVQPGSSRRRRSGRRAGRALRPAGARSRASPPPWRKAWLGAARGSGTSSTLPSAEHVVGGIVRDGPRDHRRARPRRVGRLALARIPSSAKTTGRWAASRRKSPRLASSGAWSGASRRAIDSRVLEAVGDDLSRDHRRARARPPRAPATACRFR